MLEHLLLPESITVQKTGFLQTKVANAPPSFAGVGE